MGMIKIYGQKSKAKKKPGWQDREREEKEWLAKINGIKLFEHKKPHMHGGKSTAPSKKPTIKEQLEAARKLEGKSLIDPTVAGGTKKVLRPEIQYKDNPEMLERELKARERKFAVAPAYNKGGDQLVTPEFLKDLKAGTTRRRS